MDENMFKNIPDHMLDEPVNLTYRNLGMILEMIFNRDTAAYDRLRNLETEVFGPE